MQKVIRILGTRGVPAAHAGFENFAEKMTQQRVVSGRSHRLLLGRWQRANVRRFLGGRVSRFIPVDKDAPKGTMWFNWNATLHAAKLTELCLTLGCNTPIFCALLRGRRIPNLINMNGIEWSRAKREPLAKTWFWLNERAGGWLGNHLVADHPQIAVRPGTRMRAEKVTTIPHGADVVTSAPTEPVDALGFQPDSLLLVIARAEPENSLLEVVTGYSARPRGRLLAVMGQP